MLRDMLLHKPWWRTGAPPAARAALLVAACAVFAAPGLQAAVSPERAAQLGTALTPVGANPSGNRAGTIPECIYDLQSGRYFLTALSNQDGPNDFAVRYNRKRFSPRNLQRLGTKY